MDTRCRGRGTRSGSPKFTKFRWDTAVPIIVFRLPICSLKQADTPKSTSLTCESRVNKTFWPEECSARSYRNCARQRKLDKEIERTLGLTTPPKKEKKRRRVGVGLSHWPFMSRWTTLLLCKYSKPCKHSPIIYAMTFSSK